jgi:hypothetical protein
MSRLSPPETVSADEADSLRLTIRELCAAKVRVNDDLSACRNELLDRLHAIETRCKELEAKLERIDRHWWRLW